MTLLTEFIELELLVVQGRAVPRAFFPTSNF